MEYNFDKDYFQRTWGISGYYERFGYGVGFSKVCEIALEPFFYFNNTALEIGCGGGVFTERMRDKFKYLTVVDVIERPAQFLLYESFRYIEQEDKGTSLDMIECGDGKTLENKILIMYKNFCAWKAHCSKVLTEHF